MIRRRKSAGLLDRLAGPLDDTLRVLFEDSANAALAMDDGGRIVRANARLRNMLAGAAVDLANGAPAAGIWHEEDRAYAEAVVTAGLRGQGGPRPKPLRLQGPDDDTCSVVSLSITRLAGAADAGDGAVLHLADITAEKRLEHQLAHSQKLQAVGQLAGGIAHDFNNLLQATIGAADSVLEREESRETMEDMRLIRASGERGAALVRQLLAFSRKQPLQPQVIAVNTAVRALAPLLVRMIGETIRLELDLEEPGRRVLADPTQLDQVLINLVVNARDAMPRGGTLKLRTGHRTVYCAERLGFETMPPGRYVLLEIEDTGVGISPDILPRIFEPFFTTRRERGGHGLGLSTVHGIVHQSGGFMSAESTVGQGTCMRVLLPRHEEQVVFSGPATAPAPAAAPASADASRTVLLVEDEEPVRRLAARALGRAGWRVIAAESAEAALENLPRPGDGRPAPTVLVSDVVLPGLDGPGLVKAVRAIWGGIPAVLVSGYTESALRGDPSLKGIDFLPKPYSLQNLVACVGRTAGGLVPA
ncbi:MAG: response regulator [Acetobacteraceae bacterium]|nr:response regulator [Acetobacteraceae bacterium]